MTLNGNWSRVGGEQRTEEYRRWRTTLGFGAVSDVDQVEYCAIDGRPVLAIELCVADRRSEDCPAGIPDGCGPSAGFLDAVERKVSEERPQGRFTRYFMHALGIPVLLLVYINGELDAGVWVKRIDIESPWRAMTLAEFESRLRTVHTKAREMNTALAMEAR